MATSNKSINLSSILSKDNPFYDECVIEENTDYIKLLSDFILNANYSEIKRQFYNKFTHFYSNSNFVENFKNFSDFCNDYCNRTKVYPLGDHKRSLHDFYYDNLDKYVKTNYFYSKSVLDKITQNNSSIDNTDILTKVKENSSFIRNNLLEKYKHLTNLTNSSSFKIDDDIYFNNDSEFDKYIRPKLVSYIKHNYDTVYDSILTKDTPFLINKFYNLSKPTKINLKVYTGNSGNPKHDPVVDDFYTNTWG